MNSKQKGSRGEEWRAVVGYEGLYEVSNLGRVASLPKYNFKTTRIMNPTVNKRNGRCSVILCKTPTDHKRISVHRLVATAFVDNPNRYTEVNHIDENPLNNSADNLEWCDRNYNMHYGKMNEFYKSFKRPIKAIKEGTVVNYDSITDAVKDGFSRSTIKKALRTGKISVGYKWEYDDERE